jgi:hypothetical protein
MKATQRRWRQGSFTVSFRMRKQKRGAAAKFRIKYYFVGSMKRAKLSSKFVICIRNEDCEDLAPRKLYRVLPDEAAAADGFFCVIDESGEDYLYPQDYFLPSNYLKRLRKLSCPQPERRWRSKLA